MWAVECRRQMNVVDRRMSQTGECHGSENRTLQKNNQSVNVTQPRHYMAEKCQPPVNITVQRTVAEEQRGQHAHGHA